MEGKRCREYCIMKSTQPCKPALLLSRIQVIFLNLGFLFHKMGVLLHSSQMTMCCDTMYICMCMEPKRGSGEEAVLF